MRITDISVPENGCAQVISDNFGITSKLQMPRLGKIVVLAGSNGAGKSRLLKIIDAFGNYYRGTNEPNLLMEHVCDHERNIKEWEKNLAYVEGILQSDTARDDLRSTISQIKGSIENSKSNITSLSKQLSHWQWFVTDPPGAGALPVFFVPTGPNLQDAETLAPQVLTMNAEICTKPGQGESSVTVPSYLRFVMRRARNAEHAKLAGKSEPDDEAAMVAGADLEHLVDTLLGERAKLTIDRDDHVQIFGRHDFTTSLSDGQKMLLKLAVQLHAQKTDLANALVFLDEPENHLHPAVLNQVVDVLLKEITAGQVWIATHSVPLIARLASLDPASVWFMKDGVVSHAGRKPELVLNGLLGDELEISRLRDFTDLPAKMAANRYAAECLLDPTTVGPRTQDKQQTQMVDVLLETSAGTKLRVLDFGAGQGRLLAALREAGRLDCVDYIAFDIEGNSNAACKREIESVYGIDNIEKRFFTDVSKVIELWGHVDIAIMCNVLHEIPPEDWLKEIGPESRLMELIHSDGFLLIVEDQRIPVGENAHDYGFLVLNTLQFQKLFGFSCDESESSYKKYDADQGGDGKAGRLLAHRFAKNLVMQFNTTRQKDAITDLYKTAAQEMTTLRRQAKQKKPSFQDGQLHAFWMTQYANAALWLSANEVIGVRQTT
jgi:ABC-type cobalamin/Fe3+-siderophores transport system ATPase subunit/SAM-dependent methyltransferase